MEYLLENELLRVTVMSTGAQVKSVIHKSDGAEHIWCGDPAVWKFCAPVLFPYTGRLHGGRTEIRGRVIENAPPHGVVRTLEHDLAEQGRDHLTLTVSDNAETMKIFPYRFRFRSTFRLDGQSLLHTLTVENTDREAFRFGIGYHPGFAVPFDEAHSAEDYELRFSEVESPLCLETPAGLLNGKYYRLGANLRALPLADGLLDGGGHCMTGLRSRTLGLYEKGTGRAVVCHIGDFPYCLLWSQPGPLRFVCIEPWHSLPDMEQGGGTWEEKAACAVLEPAQCWSTTLQTDFLR